MRTGDEGPASRLTAAQRDVIVEALARAIVRELDRKKRPGNTTSADQQQSRQRSEEELRRRRK